METRLVVTKIVISTDFDIGIIKVIRQGVLDLRVRDSIGDEE